MSTAGLQEMGTGVETGIDGAGAPPTSWMHDVPCIGYASLFFAALAERPQARARRENKARKLCMRCDVRIRCRDLARDRREFGFWGGENEEERTRAGFPVPNPAGSRRRRAS